MISFVSASKISFDFLSSYRLLFWYLLFRYRWAHHLCFLSMNDLSRSSFFYLSISVAFILWKKRPLLQQSVQLKQTKKKTFYGDLATSNDWTVFFELPELKAFSIKHFPQDICQTTKQVDAFVISRSRKICFVGPELTVPIEERIAFWNEKKTGKYEKMIADHGSPSWKLKCIVAEVGCRGYIPPSFRKALQLFGFTSKELKALVDECSLVSRRSSYYIWLNRFHQTFIPFQMVQVDIESYQSIAVVWTSMLVSLTHIFSFCSLCFFILCFAPFLSPPPSFFYCFIFVISIQYASRRFPGSFSLIISPNSGFSFCYVSSMAFFLKRHFRRHACISTQK